MTTGRLIRTLTGHADFVWSVAFSPDGRWLASGSWDKTIKVWEVATGRLVRTLTGHADSVLSVAFSPDGRWLASGSGDWTVKVWEAATGRLVRTLIGGPSRSAADLLGTRWAEREGNVQVGDPHLGLVGIWTRRGTSNVFDAEWTLGNQHARGVLTMTVNGNAIHIQRVDRPDNNCVYDGVLSADRRIISGTYRCVGFTGSTSGSGNWWARIE